MAGHGDTAPKEQLQAPRPPQAPAPMLQPPSGATTYSIASNSDCNTSVSSSWYVPADPKKDVEEARADLVRRIVDTPHPWPARQPELTPQPSNVLEVSAKEVEKRLLKEAAPCIHDACYVVPLQDSDRDAGSEFGLNCAQSDLSGYTSRYVAYKGPVLGARAQALAGMDVDSMFSFTTADMISSEAAPAQPQPQATVTPAPQAPEPQTPASSYVLQMIAEE